MHLLKKVMISLLFASEIGKTQKHNSKRQPAQNVNDAAVEPESKLGSAQMNCSIETINGQRTWTRNRLVD